MKAKMGAQASKSNWMSWVFLSITVVAGACALIPGIGLIAAASLYTVTIVGGVMKTMLENDKSNCNELVANISSG